jgi:hypothetical protein
MTKITLFLFSSLIITATSCSTETKNESVSDKTEVTQGQNNTPNKKEILENAKGVYYLNSISGFAGANHMYETSKENNIWVSSESAIVYGTRASDDYKLSKQDITLLNSIRIEIDNELTIRLFSEENQLLASSFIENGMDYRVKEKRVEEMNEEISKLSPTTIIQDKKYIIIADDEIDFSKFIKGNFRINTTDDLILSYSPDEKSFILDIISADPPDRNTLYFTKK